MTDGQDEQRASQVVMILLRLFRALERVDTDLTPQQYRILKLAGAGGERSAKLAERLAVAKPTLTATADGLVAAGYARRDAEPGDRRVVRLCLTDSGRDAVDRADAAYGRWLDQVLAETGEPDQVLHALDALNEAMDEARRARHGARPEPDRRSGPTETSALNATPPPTLAAPPPGRRTVRRRAGMRAPARGKAASGAPAGSGTGAGWLRRLAGYCWRHRRLEIMALGGSLVATLVQASIPLIMAWIVDSAIIAHHEPIWLGASVLIVAGLLSFAGVYTRRYRGGQLSLEVQHDMRTELFASLSQLDGARQDQLHTGQIVSRAISDLNMVQSLLSMVPMLLGNALLFVLSIGIMAYLSPVLTLVALAIAPALWLIAIASRRKLFPASWDAQQKESDVAGVVDGAVTGVRVVKGFGQEEQEIERLEGVARVLYSARVRVVRLTARYNPALGAIPMFGQVGVLALGGWLALHGSIKIGVFLAFSLYIGQMVAPVRALSSLITIGQEARASVIRVYEVIDSKPVVTEKPGAVVLPPGTPDVELDDVAFGYLPSQPVLRGLSLHVRPGETVAVVGTSGSGKSTISLLLPRFYDVRGGAIRVGGHDVRDLTLDSLRASIGLVMEDSFLFSDTIRANISYGRPDATQEQIVAAARAAEADEFITGLPDGYDTVIGEQGLTLSGGQRQRVSLARALITDPAILILDDATSAIDAAVEAQIHATLHKVMAGRTTLLIAHRRSTLQLADRIAVLDEGRLVDEGTHDELTARCPLYRLLLAGPGDDAEGIDAGELAYQENVGRGDLARRSRPPAA